MKYRFITIAIVAVVFLNISSPAICYHFFFVEGFQCTTRNTADVIMFAAITLFVALLLPTYDSAETAIIWLMYICQLASISVALPALGIPQFEAYEYYVFCSALFVLGARLVPLIDINIPMPRFSTTTVPVGTIIVSAVFLLLLLTSFSISFVLPKITDVYTVRTNYENVLEDSSNGFLGYILAYVPILSGYFFAVVTMFVGVHYWLRKKRLISAISFFLALTQSIAVFSLSGFKSVAFIFIVVLLLLVSLRNRRHPLLGFLIAFLGAAILAALLAYFSIDENPFYQWVRRAMVSPGMNAVYYLRLFGLSSGQLHPDAAGLVSLVFYGTNGSANTGMFGSGIGAGGFFGVLFHAAVFFGFLVLLRNFARNVPPYVAISLALPVGYAFVNSSPLTVLVTYGGFFIAIYLWLWGAHLYALDARQPQSPPPQLAQ